MSYGAVVLSVNVSVFEYEPVRSASLAPIVWVKRTWTGSFDTGLVQFTSVSGAPLTEPAPAEVPAGLVPTVFSAVGRLNVPLTRWPGAVVLGSVTDSAALPAVEMTFAVMFAV